MTAKRVLPADVYDALELSALAYGGIGAADWFEDAKGDIPLCIFGHADFIAGDYSPGSSAIANTLRSRANIGVPENDYAVQMLNRGLGKPKNSRISFSDWCAELGVVRGT